MADQEMVKVDSMAARERIAATLELVGRLNENVGRLEALHKGRKFSLDGHLVGSLGEVIAKEMFKIQLVTASSTGHDAIEEVGERRLVEIKATFGTRGVALRTTSDTAKSALIVLKLSKDPSEGPTVIFNGPLAVAFRAAGKFGSNGQARMSLSRLSELNQTVEEASRVPIRDR